MHNDFLEYYFIFFFNRTHNAGDDGFEGFFVVAPYFDIRRFFDLTFTDNMSKITNGRTSLRSILFVIVCRSRLSWLGDLFIIKYFFFFFLRPGDNDIAMHMRYIYHRHFLFLQKKVTPFFGELFCIMHACARLLIIGHVSPINIS